MRASLSLGAGLVLGCALLQAGPATPTSGILFYTSYTGTPSVAKVGYNYDPSGSGFTLGASSTIVNLGAGADGIMFAPNGTLLVGGQHAYEVFQYTKSGTLITSAYTDSVSHTDASFHLAMDPTGSYVYSSDTYDSFGSGKLEVLPYSGGQVHDGTVYSVGGDDTSITSMQYTPYGWYYVYDTGANGNGNFGTVDLSSLSSISTTRLYGALSSAHSLAYDRFTGLVTLFGGGAVGSYDPAHPTVAPKQRTGITCDFDQGAVDGRGHALIAGCNQITFIDYSASGDITDAANPTYVIGGYDHIDDVAPLSGLGSDPGTPEPGTFVLFGAAMLAAAARRLNRR